MALEAWRKGTEDPSRSFPICSTISPGLGSIAPVEPARRRPAGWRDSPAGKRGASCTNRPDQEHGRRPQRSGRCAERGLETRPGRPCAFLPADDYRKLLVRALLQLGRAREVQELLEAVLSGPAIAVPIRKPPGS